MKHTLRMFFALGFVIVITAFLFTSLRTPRAGYLGNPLLLDLLQALIVVLATYSIVRWDLMRPILRITKWMKELRQGASGPTPPADSRHLQPLAKEVTKMAESLTEAMAAAEEEARLRQTRNSLWTAERLKEHARQQLSGKPLFVVSNREPYQHMRNGKDVKVITPPSGLVTALEPILRACGGTWIAQAYGSADQEVVDQNDRIQVPPERPAYTLRRVWVSPEDEKGFYYGFSNEGLWPLCHVAYTRPVFRPEDWEAYKRVNAQFADVLLSEMENTTEPCVFVQDYHFALLPKMIKEKRPDARVALFWHIPWPNPESFGICPWRKDLLLGMLGADLLGFHIQYHCNHFLDTVDQVLETRIDWERFTVNRQNHTTVVKPFPISVAVTSRGTPVNKIEFRNKAALLKRLGIRARFLGVGVDRLDYTKGILERFKSIERLLETTPSLIGAFTFVELGAPSRSSIATYDDLIKKIEQEAHNINERFQTFEWRPIVFLKDSHSHEDIEPYYKAADVCMVTSLHDGMNLVAKEFVAARDDEDGVLILSRFTGASRELRDALIINPYDINQTADAIRVALEMTDEERQVRMHRMRENVLNNNVYRWGANILRELSQIRTKVPAEVSRT